MTITRRTLLVAPLIMTTIKSYGSENNKQHYFLDESGSIHENGNFSPFVSGLLRLEKPEFISEEILKIRKDRSFFCQFTYHSTNKYKLETALDIVELFARCDGCRLFVYTVPNRNGKSWPTKKIEKEAAYNRHNTKILTNSIVNPGNSVIHIERRSISGRDRSLLESLNFEFEGNASVEHVSGKRNDLLQMCDLLTGCIFSAQRQPQEKVNKMKAIITKRFLTSVGVSSYSDLQKSGAFGKLNLKFASRL